MTTSIRPKDRDAVIQSLRAGVVPRTGQHLVLPASLCWGDLTIAGQVLRAEITVDHVCDLLAIF